MSLNETPEESIYTVNFRKAWITPEYKRTNRVVGILREFAKRHMKTDDIKIDQYLNRYLWMRGKRNPPRKIRVRMTKDETDTVVVSLYEEFKERKSQTEDLEVKQEVGRKSQTEDLEVKQEVGRKSQTEDLEVKQEVETPEEQPARKKKKEAEGKEQAEPEVSTKKEGKDVAATNPDEANKKEPERKTDEKPKKKSTRKKKPVDQET
jgi:large subunit ribosomal protein L31e